MSHMQHPTSIDISNEDYSVEILCSQEYQFLHDDPSTPPPSYTAVFPHEISLRFRVDIQLVSSSDHNDHVTYQSTMEEVSLPSDELFSSRCGEALEGSLDIVYIPFSLSDKIIDWCGIHIRPGPRETHVCCKLLRNMGELVSEIVGYIGKTREDHTLPLERMVVQLHIKKLVAQPAGVVLSWRNWSRDLWDEYYEFVYVKPLEYLGRGSVVKILERLRQQEGEFDPEEICSICMEGLLKKENGGGGGGGGKAVTRLECSHLYHESCILVWLVNQNSCPYCRADVGNYLHSLHDIDM